MADPADEYLGSKLDAYALAAAEAERQAMARKAMRDRRIAAMYRHVAAVDPGYAADQYQRVQSHLASGAQRADAGMEEAERALEFARQNHPVQVAKEVATKAMATDAPDLSLWQWWQQNPSILQAQPLTDAERKSQVQLAALLEGMHEADQRFPPSHPYNLGGYGATDPKAGPDGDRIRALLGEYSPEYVATLRSPYRYREYFHNDRGEWAPILDRQGGLEVGAIGDAMTLASAGAGATAAPRALAGLFLAGNLMQAHDTYIPAVQQVWRGDIGGLADTVARVPLAAINPSFASGRAGGPADWRRGVPMEFSGAADAILPWVTPMPALGRLRALGQPATARSAVEEGRRLQRELAKRYHPDRTGGSDEMMRQVKQAIERGDLQWLRAALMQ